MNPERDPHPDSAPDVSEDERSDIEQAVDGRSDALAREGGGSTGSPLAPPGVDDGVSGTGGVTKNQDDMAQ